MLLNAAKTKQDTMKLSQLTTALQELNEVNFILPDGSFIPRHYHLTEIGLSTKEFIDCGTKRHTNKKITLQLWVNVDYNHRLKADKFLNIINSSSSLFNNEDLDVEVEYQTSTIGLYNLDFDGNNFRLLTTKTDCLATELCGIDSISSKPKMALSDLGASDDSCCTPGSGCC
jgi:hypothetical protein